MRMRSQLSEAITYVIEGDITDEQFAAIKKHCINPVDSRDTGWKSQRHLYRSLMILLMFIFDGFKDMAEDKLKELYSLEPCHDI